MHFHRRKVVLDPLSQLRKTWVTSLRDKTGILFNPLVDVKCLAWRVIERNDSGTIARRNLQLLDAGGKLSQVESGNRPADVHITPANDRWRVDPDCVERNPGHAC